MINAYLLTFMMCLPGGPNAECRWQNMELPDLKTCAAMRRLVIQEAKEEGFHLKHAVCTSLPKETTK